MSPNTDKVAVVAGGSRGIGGATSRLLASRGMRVVVNYRTSDADAKAVVEAIHSAGGEAMAVRADVSKPDEVDRLMQTVTAEWGTVDVLVNTVLIPYAIKPFQEMSWTEFGGKLQDEMLAAFTLTRAVTPGMIAKGYGRIVHLGTNLAKNPRAGMIALGASKSALTTFARYVAQELGPHGITVNIVSPGMVGTQISTTVPEAVRDRIIATTPLGRIAKPEDVARVIAFYADDDSGFVTGSTAPVNGGLAMD
ncbi:SDR family NAD(P)-dependent oxidoreductase [Mycobacterium sp. 852002-10029_SCH5224772]|uniref:SDR family NAD(P)-dependent oxidoreductase n=1 Tax=Mycobacterium sp. 852002-10029_SCH5224772 TaxID=1834083 RepID=UPI0007FE8127|nr:SDR family oxidoreductase [Mycobacterium sp. 852002-10029_SCH5224772]OBF02087.1 short-chain dehydrogenase [Mycobacterium sp. 852002-10029_SCH5224772]